MGGAQAEINKHEAGQMNSHCGWFEEQYGKAHLKRILVIPSKNLSYYANLTHEFFVMRKGKLKHLKANIKSFIKEFKSYKLNEITDAKIQGWLSTHKLNIEDLETDYTESIYKMPAKLKV